MKLILHIGNHKTGSTAIQTALSQEYDYLLSMGVLYPKAARVRNAHHNMVLSQTKKNIPGFQVMESFEYYLNELSSEIKSCPGIETVIISSEEFFTSKAEEFTKLSGLFSMFDQVDMVCVLRNQLDHIESSYKFSVLWDQVDERRLFGDYLSFNLSSDYHKYYSKLAGIQRSGMFNSIKVLSFSELVSNGALVSNFMEELGYSDCNLKEVSSNESLSRLGTMLLLSYDLNAPVESVVRDEYIKRLMNTFKASKDSLYSKALFEHAYEFFENDNKLLIEEFGVDLNRTMAEKNRDELKGFLFNYDEVFQVLQAGYKIL